MCKEVSIMEEDWDNIIILDACRYDYFSRVYKRYLSGRLQKVKSVGSHSLEWCLKNFTRLYDDVVYISANLFINSGYKLTDFNASNHFHKVVDVWNSGWDDELGTVHPREVNEAVRIWKRRHPDKRFIIHYSQPHAPYIGGRLPSPGYEISFDRDRTPLITTRDYQDTDSKADESILQRPLVLLFKFIGEGIRSIERKGIHIGSLDWRLHEVFGLPPVCPMDAMRRKVGVGGLRSAYSENLEFVLGYVEDLLQDLRGTCIITSDHGERLGERGGYEHPMGFSDPLLLEVPWFEVRTTTGRRESPKDLEKLRIQRKIDQLRVLGKI